MKISNAKYIYKLYRIADSNNFVFGFNLGFSPLIFRFHFDTHRNRTEMPLFARRYCHTMYGGVVSMAARRIITQRPHIIHLSIFPFFEHTLDLLASIMRCCLCVCITSEHILQPR